MSTLRQFTVEMLETLEVPAGIFLDTATHTLTITGDPGADHGITRWATVAQTVNGAVIQTPDTQNIEAVIQTSTGYQMSRLITASDVANIVYVGRGGNDVFTNTTTKPFTQGTTATGTVSSSVLPGSPGNLNNDDLNRVGVFVVGSTGTVEVDFLFCGAGYRGQLGFYSLEGMDALTAGSQAYIAESARRVLSNSTLGRLAIDRTVEQAKYSSSVPWEGNMNTGGIYVGPKALSFTPSQRLGAMLVPSGRFTDVLANPAASGSLRPLFSLPAANPYTITPQLLGQVGDLTGNGSTFAFEDLRLDSSSDRDYNDMVFQIVGGRGTATPISDVTNMNRDFIHTGFGQNLATYTAQRIASDTSVSGVYSTGKFLISPDGKVTVDYLFDSGGYVSQMGIFSLQGMGAYTPGSPEFIHEAARRVVSNSVLGGLAIDDTTEGARYATGSDLLRSFNQGDYRGVRTLNLSPGDTVAFMPIPNGTTWESFTGRTSDPFKLPVFSMPEANPASSYGSAALANAQGNGLVLAFEDTRLDVTGIKASDRDYNDVVFRTSGLSPLAPIPTVGDIASPGRDWTSTVLGQMIRTNT